MPSYFIRNELIFVSKSSHILSILLTVTGVFSNIILSMIFNSYKSFARMFILLAASAALELSFQIMLGKLMEVYPNAEFKIFEHSGHMPFISESDLFNQCIEQFLL